MSDPLTANPVPLETEQLAEQLAEQYHEQITVQAREIERLTGEVAMLRQEIERLTKGDNQ